MSLPFDSGGLRVEALRHTYRGGQIEAREVLNIDQWALEPGQQALVRGVSGSGKTTLLNILAGLLTPTAGAACFEGQSLYTLGEAARDRFRATHIGYVFQMHHLMPSLTALENVIMPMAFARKYPRISWRQRAAALLEQVGLAEFTRHRPAQLSAGQRLRVVIARALANDPRLFLADEPTAALDSEASNIVMDLVQQSCRAHAAILVVASHDPSLTDRFSAVFDLRAGRLNPAELMVR